MTEVQSLLHGKRFCKQSMMLPHDIVSTVYKYQDNFQMLFLGVPGRLERYWSENMDFFATLEEASCEPWQTPQTFVGLYMLLAHAAKQVRVQIPKDNVVPLRVYGDGADAQQHFEIMTILPVLSASSSTLDSRILVSVRNSDKTTNEARYKILEVLSWSFNALDLGMDLKFSGFLGLGCLGTRIYCSEPSIPKVWGTCQNSTAVVSLGLRICGTSK